MNQDIQDLKQLKEFYEQYRHTDQTYINLVKQKENYKQQLYNINKVIADNKKFGWWLLVIGIVTIPIFIGIILIPVSIISFIVASIQFKTKDKKEQKILQEFETFINQTLGFLTQQYNQTNKCIAFEYASPFIVYKLIQYLEYGRVDTLKEAINTYENEKAISIQQKQLQEIANTQKKIALSTAYLAYDTYMNNLQRLI